MNTRHNVKTRYRARAAVLALAASCAVLAQAPAAAQAPAVTLAWEAIADSGVAGYIVYVGNDPGSHVEQYDAGNRTTFVYSRGSAGRPYYFAVAAYAHDGTVGPRSEEILFLGGSATTAAPLVSTDTTRTRQTDGSSFTIPGVLCQGDAATCYSVETLTELPGRVIALTPTGDGRLLVIHDRRHVRVIAQGVLLPDAALTSAPGVEISGVALDPAFDRNRHVYVGEVETRADGSRTMAVRRYREVASTLAEGATIVASLALPRTGDAPFTIDAVGRIYLAIPSAMDDSAGGLPYAGLVLRFERDGTVSRDSRAGSPIIARGFDRPVSLVWNSATDALWLAGSTMQGAADLVQLPLQTASSEWPRMPARADVAAELPVATLSSGPRAARGARVLAIDDTGSLLQIDAATRAIVNSLALADLGRDAASAALDDGSIYLALSGPDATTSQIVRLRRQ